MVEKPTAAHILSLIGAILVLIGGIAFAVIFAVGGAFLAGFGALVPFAGFLGVLFLIIAAVHLIFGIIMLIGATWINSTDIEKVRNGSIIVLIFSIIGLLFGSGFFIGPILGLVGGILGLVWKPTVPEPPPMPPP